MAARYVYAILPRDAALPTVTGLQSGPLSFVPHRDLCAATSIIDPADVRLTPENAVRHEAVVEALRQSSPALPVRFGTVLPDEPAVIRALSEHYAALLADLTRLTDTVEYGLTVLWEQPTPDGEAEQIPTNEAAAEGDGPGTRYLRARLAAHRHDTGRRERAAEAAQALDAQLRPAALDGRWTIQPTTRLAARAAYLLQPSSIEAFQQAFEGARAACPSLRPILSGPWPPYTFVTVREGSADSNLSGIEGRESRR